MSALSLPTESDAGGKLVVLLENIEAQIANTADFEITVAEVTSAIVLPNATAVDVVTTAPTTAAYGFTDAQAIAVLANINALVADVEALRQLNATLVSALAALGGVTIAA